jgi:hypothetical protein
MHEVHGFTPYAQAPAPQHMRREPWAQAPAPQHMRITSHVLRCGRLGASRGFFFVTAPQQCSNSPDMPAQGSRDMHVANVARERKAHGASLAAGWARSSSLSTASTVASSRILYWSLPSTIDTVASSTAPHSPTSVPLLAASRLGTGCTKARPKKRSIGSHQTYHVACSTPEVSLTFTTAQHKICDIA